MLLAKYTITLTNSSCCQTRWKWEINQTLSEGTIWAGHTIAGVCMKMFNVWQKFQLTAGDLNNQKHLIIAYFPYQFVYLFWSKLTKESNESERSKLNFWSSAHHTYSCSALNLTLGSLIWHVKIMSFWDFWPVSVSLNYLMVIKIPLKSGEYIYSLNFIHSAVEL